MFHLSSESLYGPFLRLLTTCHLWLIQRSVHTSQNIFAKAYVKLPQFIGNEFAHTTRDTPPKMCLTALLSWHASMPLEGYSEP